MNHNRIHIRKLVLAALCLVLPLLTGQIPEIGSMLSPMHIPVLLCGLSAGRRGCAAGALCTVRHVAALSDGRCHVL